MIKATVQNFRGIQRAEIDVSPIALICGLNGAGKSSIARAIASAAIGHAIPYENVTKKGANIMVRHGSIDGRSVLQSEGSETTVIWPVGEVTSSGLNPVSCSSVAAGLASIMHMPKKDALSFMIHILKASPTREDLEGALAEDDKPASPKVVDAIWDAVNKENGWDIAHKRALETRAQLKGAWSQITGENYGDKKAREWKPKDWRDGMETETIEQCHTDIQAAQTELEREIAKNAVSTAERLRLKELADLYPEFEKKVEAKKAEYVQLEKELSEVIEKLKNTPNPAPKKEYKCPHCENSVNISAISGNEYLITKAGEIDKAKLDEARMEYAGLCGKQANIQNRISAAKHEYSALCAEGNQAFDAREKLEKMTDASIQESNEEDIANARKRLEQSQRVLAAITAKKEADAQLKKIDTNQKLVDMLDESGLRKKKLEQNIKDFCRSYLQPVTEDFEMPEIKIDSDLNVSIGKVPYNMLSESEQFRVRTALQIAIAKLENAGIVIIDGADILDKKWRVGLLNAVVNSEIPTVICMTVANPGLVPNLSDMGCGVTYWVENATCAPVISERKAA